MIGQWLADVQDEDDDPSASLRIDLEDRGSGCFGHAYMFYPGTDLPGFLYPVRLPKEPPYKAKVGVLYLYPHGGTMTQAERNATEAYLKETQGEPPPATMDVEFSLDGDRLKIDWSADDARKGSVALTKSDATGPSVT